VDDIKRLNVNDRAAATRIFTTSADLSEMPRGTADMETMDDEEDFWLRLVKAYQWMDADTQVIRPDLTGPDVPPEAHALFSRGRSEEENERLLRRSPLKLGGK
jgi:hypothetical protein